MWVNCSQNCFPVFFFSITNNMSGKNSGPWIFDSAECIPPGQVPRWGQLFIILIEPAKLPYKTSILTNSVWGYPYCLWTFPGHLFKGLRKRGGDNFRMHHIRQSGKEFIHINQIQWVFSVFYKASALPEGSPSKIAQPLPLKSCQSLPQANFRLSTLDLE